MLGPMGPQHDLKQYDLIYLKNQWSVGQTYLDVDRIATCGSTTKLSVVTNPEPNQAGEGTGTWKIID